MLLFTKESSIGVSCFPVHQTTSILQFSYASSTFLSVDQTVDDFPCARDAHRSCSRKVGTPCGKRAVTTPTDYPASTDQATRLPEEGPAAPGASGQAGFGLETGALPRSAGDTFAASIGSSSVGSGSTHRRRVRNGRVGPAVVQALLPFLRAGLLGWRSLLGSLPALLSLSIELRTLRRRTRLGHLARGFFGSPIFRWCFARIRWCVLRMVWLF
jgi:hypothetical protein